MGPRLKNFKQTLKKSKNVSLDSSCFIYHIEKNRKYLELTRIIFKELLPNGNIQASGSTMIITEILIKPYRLGRHQLALAYKTLIKALPNFSLFATDEQIATEAAKIRAKYNLRTPDAIHIATAIESGAKAIIANDRRWHQVKEIKTIILEDFTR